MYARLFITLVCFLMIVLSVNAQTTNTRTPRTVSLECVASTHDDSGNFIFKRPHSLILLKDGSFLVIDDGKVLKFREDGKFLKTIVRKGQGPSEATHIFQLFVRNDNELVVNTGFMQKLMTFDPDGTLKAEYRRRKNHKSWGKGLSLGESTFRILEYVKNSGYIVISYTANTKQAHRKNSKEYPLLLLSTENEWKKKLIDIPVEAAVFKTVLGKTPVATQAILTASDGNYLYFSNTPRYTIKRLSLKNLKFETDIKRDYLPVKIPEASKEKYKYGELIMGSRKGKSFKLSAPPRNDFIDIQKLLVVDGNLWVITSTVDSEKGVLVDVFDGNGKYSGCFNFPVPGTKDWHYLYQGKFNIRGNYLLTRETDDEGNYKVVKYKIIQNK